MGNGGGLLISPDGVASTWMVNVSASVRKMVVCVRVCVCVCVLNCETWWLGLKLTGCCQAKVCHMLRPVSATANTIFRFYLTNHPVHSYFGMGLVPQTESLGTTAAAAAAAGCLPVVHQTLSKHIYIQAYIHR